MSQLYIADNAVTCLVSLIMKVQMFSEETADIIVTDRVSGAEERSERIRELGLFRNVYFIETNSCNVKLPKWKHFYKKARCFCFGCNLDIVKKLKYDYTDIFVLHPDCLANAISVTMQKKGIIPSIHIMEEGYGSYTDFYKKMDIEGYNKGRYVFEYICAWKNRCRRTMDLIKDIYFFDPDMLQWTPSFGVKTIKKPDFINYPQLKDILNYAFSYKEAYGEYDGKSVIYFEDCMYQDTGNNSDFDIIERIADITGKDKLLIKLHPRTTVNRFQGIYQTNNVQGIPWEIIAMNLDDSEKKLFISLVSGSVITYSYIFPKRFKTLLLFKCVPDAKIDANLCKFLEMYAKMHPEYLSIPENIECALDEVRKICEQ